MAEASSPVHEHDSISDTQYTEYCLLTLLVSMGKAWESW